MKAALYVLLPRGLVSAFNIHNTIHLRREQLVLTRLPTALNSIDIGRKNEPATFLKDSEPLMRFERTADSESAVDRPCILTIQGKHYNMTAWAKAHPGGNKILERFHDKDATKAFFAAGHSQRAIDMLQDFFIDDIDDGDCENFVSPDTLKMGLQTVGALNNNERPSFVFQVRTKLFTKEDPIGIHKYCGIFVLFHFAYRYTRAFFGDPTAGLGNWQGHTSNILSLACIIPHTILSLSSLIFHTVPRERIIGQPMIWKEFRAHNIIFGMRSIICTVLAWTAVHQPSLRRVAVVGSSITVLCALRAADCATEKLRENSRESTTATMPYWEGCSIGTQKIFKTFYAFSQFMATFATIITLNPAWPLLVLFPIQFASLLMTLVRKGLLSAKSYHIIYACSLCLPYISAIRCGWLTKTLDVPMMTLLAAAIFAMRRKGVNKYVLWGSMAGARVFFGEQFLNWQTWTY